jgi:BASS family bile acid:Na+ symporter
VEPRAVALIIAKAFLAPLLAGMLLRWPLLKIAESLSQRILGVAGTVLSVASLALLALHWRLLAEIGWGPLSALVGMTAVALAIGHALGGPDPADRTALAISCASRYVGIAMLAASTVPGPRTIALVIAYTIASAAASIPFLKWRARAAGAASRQ